MSSFLKKHVSVQHLSIFLPGKLVTGMVFWAHLVIRRHLSLACPKLCIFVDLLSWSVVLEMMRRELEAGTRDRDGSGGNFLIPVWICGNYLHLSGCDYAGLTCHTAALLNLQHM